MSSCSLLCRSADLVPPSIVRRSAVELDKQWPRCASKVDDSDGGESAGVEFYIDMMLKTTSSSTFTGGSFIVTGSGQSGQEEQEEFVGHVRASVTESPTCGSEAIAVTFVIIDQAQRGSGYGSKVMRLVEAKLKEMGFEYVYLWTTSAVGFYKKLGYKLCTPVSLSKPCLEGRDLGGLEAMLRKRLNANSEMLTNLETKKTDVWLRLRLRDWDAGGYKPLGFRTEVDNTVMLPAFLHLRQVGPSCGLAACRMALRFLKNDNTPEEEDLLQSAIRKGYTEDGEVFKIHDLAAICEEILNLSCSVKEFAEISTEEITNMLALKEQLVVIPYDHHQGRNAPYLNKGRSSHFGVLVGIANVGAICFVAQGMNANAAEGSLDDYRASNAQLAETDYTYGDKPNLLGGQVLVITL